MADPKDPECCEVPQCITVPPNPTNGTIVITGVTGQIIVSANKISSLNLQQIHLVFYFFFGLEFNEFLSQEYYDTFILYDILYRILLEQVW